MSIKTGGTIPSHIWARKADQQTRDEVEEALALAFNKARNSAPQRRNGALREATFEVPHELARLNSDAPGFRLEDLGPMVRGRRFRTGLARSSTALRRLSTARRRPVDACPLILPQWREESDRRLRGRQLRAQVRFAQETAACRGRHGHTRVPQGGSLGECLEDPTPDLGAKKSAVIGRIQDVERLPVIFNFRHEAFGAMDCTRLGMILDPSMCLIPLATTHLNRGILQE